MNKKSNSVAISRRQVVAAIKAYDLAVENIEGFIDGISIPQKNTPAENKELARYRRQLKDLKSQQAALKELR